MKPTPATTLAKCALVFDLEEERSSNQTLTTYYWNYRDSAFALETVVNFIFRHLHLAGIPFSFWGHLDVIHALGSVGSECFDRVCATSYRKRHLRLHICGKCQAVSHCEPETIPNTKHFTILHLGGFHTVFYHILEHLGIDIVTIIRGRKRRMHQRAG